jgi:hypothetical protein
MARRPLLFIRKRFAKNEEISRGIIKMKLLETPRLRHHAGGSRTGWEVLLVQCLDVTHPDPESRAAPGRFFRVVEVKSDAISLDNCEPFVLVGGDEAQLSVKGQGLLQVSNLEARSKGMEDRSTCL